MRIHSVWNCSLIVHVFLLVKTISASKKPEDFEIYEIENSNCIWNPWTSLVRDMILRNTHCLIKNIPLSRPEPISFEKTIKSVLISSDSINDNENIFLSYLYRRKPPAWISQPKNSVCFRNNIFVNSFHQSIAEIEKSKKRALEIIKEYGQDILQTIKYLQNLIDMHTYLLYINNMPYAEWNRKKAYFLTKKTLIAFKMDHLYKATASILSNFNRLLFYKNNQMIDLEIISENMEITAKKLGKIDIRKDFEWIYTVNKKVSQIPNIPTITTSLVEEIVEIFAPSDQRASSSAYDYRKENRNIDLLKKLSRLYSSISQMETQVRSFGVYSEIWESVVMIRYHSFNNQGELFAYIIYDRKTKIIKVEYDLLEYIMTAESISELNTLTKEFPVYSDDKSSTTSI